MNPQTYEVRVVGDPQTATFPYALYIDGRYVNAYQYWDHADQAGRVKTLKLSPPMSIYDVSEVDEVVFDL